MSPADEAIAFLVVRLRRAQADNRALVAELQAEIDGAAEAMSVTGASLGGLEAHAATLGIDLSGWDADGEPIAARNVA